MALPYVTEAKVLQILMEVLKPFETDDIEHLPAEKLDELKCGDQVIKISGDEKHAYIVSYKKEDEISLVYCDHQNVEELYYEKKDGNWDSEALKEITHIGE